MRIQVLSKVLDPCPASSLSSLPCWASAGAGAGVVGGQATWRGEGQKARVPASLERWCSGFLTAPWEAELGKCPPPTGLSPPLGISAGNILQSASKESTHSPLEL